MVTTLSDLVEMIEEGTIPDWLRNEIVAKREQIEQLLSEGGSITLEGPNHESIVISASERVAPAA